jgi:hypothetical protein
MAMRVRSAARGGAGSGGEVSRGCVWVMEGGIGYGRASFVTEAVIAAASGGRLSGTERGVAVFAGIEKGHGGRQTSRCAGLRVALVGLREPRTVVSRVIRGERERARVKAVVWCEVRGFAIQSPVTADRGRGGVSPSERETVGVLARYATCR